MAKKDKADDGVKVITRNRKAFHEYEITDRLEAGLVLVGTEVKALRAGFGLLDGAYVKLEGGELWLVGAEIAEYEKGNQLNHKPKRTRKLLVHRREIDKFAGKATQKGMTLVPLQIYFKEGRAKVELALAKGRTKGDHRQAMAERDAKAEVAKSLGRQRKGMG